MRHTPRLLGILACTLVLGCANSAPPVTKAQPISKPAAAEQIWHGQLLRKGAELDSWFALLDDQGKTWRLAKLTPEAIQSLIQHQHQRIAVTGIQGADWLATPVIEVRQWSEEK
jgi:hypothetical protein